MQGEKGRVNCGVCSMNPVQGNPAVQAATTCFATKSFITRLARRLISYRPQTLPHVVHRTTTGRSYGLGLSNHADPPHFHAPQNGRALAREHSPREEHRPEEGQRLRRLLPRRAWAPVTCAPPAARDKDPSMARTLACPATRPTTCVATWRPLINLHVLALHPLSRPLCNKRRWRWM